MVFNISDWQFMIIKKIVKMFLMFSICVYSPITNSCNGWRSNLSKYLINMGHTFLSEIYTNGMNLLIESE